MSMPPKPDTSKRGCKEPKGSVKNITEQVGGLKIEDSHSKDSKQGNDGTPETKSKGTVRKKGARRPLLIDIKKCNTNNGECMENHPWEPNRPKIMPDEMDESAVYTVGKNWKHWDKVDLRKIYQHLPKFVKEMKGKTCRQELEEVLQLDKSSDTRDSETEASANKDTDKEGSGNDGSENNSSANKDMESGSSETKAPPKMLRFKPISDEYLTPHVKEVVYMQRKKDEPKDKPDLPDTPKVKESFRAYSLPRPQNPQQKPNIWFLDCEYMCKVHLPGNTSDWLDDSDKSGKRIRAIKPDKIDQRWIFTPSFRRAKIALLDWPDDRILNSKNTIRILVVRPTEFEEYVKYCGDKFHIISLPNDEIGAGYPRLWIQKIALRLKLNFIWMIDDSLLCFYEYHPDDGEETIYDPDRRRKFSIVFKSIEYFVQCASSHTVPIAAMSPRQFRGAKPPLFEQLACLPPQIAVYLNLEALKSRDIYYRPELQVLEDMVFGYECEQNGLKVFVDNRIQLKDKDWRDTGARSISVQQKMREADEVFEANTTTQLIFRY
ncbi:uncharacterized protein LOC111332197 [Stylophora pistillata]|uniref:TET-Associated Glycosyltransferase domain-containing protein n=1 Tax=Stylophora pistillata TaxID=50429 RepID=A0A2B4S6D1_STYPI|nr:uncharacterized protein LOC111332197 [Stylophora pistillata]PFX24045.1 hypothetical protein AWC38_SpisGene11395 [Stylophora pistillata]